MRNTMLKINSKKIMDEISRYPPLVLYIQNRSYDHLFQAFKFATSEDIELILKSMSAEELNDDFIRNVPLNNSFMYSRLGLFILKKYPDLFKFFLNREIPENLFIIGTDVLFQKTVKAFEVNALLDMADRVNDMIAKYLDWYKVSNFEKANQINKIKMICGSRNKYHFEFEDEIIETIKSDPEYFMKNASHYLRSNAKYFKPFWNTIEFYVFISDAFSDPQINSSITFEDFTVPEIVYTLYQNGYYNSNTHKNLQINNIIITQKSLIAINKPH